MTKKFQIIYADPPWKFGSKYPTGTGHKSLNKHYKTQRPDWIKKLPVALICDDNAAIFMWVPDSHFQEGIDTMKAWGFKYINVAFVWEKVSNRGNTLYNLAPWTMKSYEFCLFGTRGKMHKYKKANNILQKTVAIRRAHSQKPDEVRDKIVSLFGNLNRIELFARKQFDGWDSWGDQVECTINLGGDDNE